MDMRAVNGVANGLAHPLPRIDYTLDSLARARWYTTLDLAAVYWKISLSASDREKMAFFRGVGLYQFRVTAMGLKNASGTFHNLMGLVLAGMAATTCLACLDDAILFSRTKDEHLKMMRAVFDRIRAV